MHKKESMPYKRLDITLHPEDLQKLDRIAKARGYSRSSMLAKLIQEYNEKVK